MAGQARVAVVFVGALLLGFYASFFLYRAQPIASFSALGERSITSSISPSSSSSSSVESLISDIASALKNLGSQQQQGEGAGGEHDPQHGHGESAAVQDNTVAVNVVIPGSQELLGEVKSLNSLLKTLVANGGKSSKGGAGAAPAGAQVIQSISTTTAKSSATRQKDISSLANGRCLDMHSSYDNNGIKIYGCNQGLGQSFFFTASGEIRHGTGYCIDSKGGKNGAVKLSFCNHGDSQKWEIVNPTRPFTQLRNKGNGHCMDFRNDDYVTTTPCSTTCNQRWSPNAGGQSIAANEPTPRKKPRPNGRLLCWVLTQPEDHATKAVAINNTWGQECDTLLFISTDPYPGLDVVVLDMGQDESRKILWMKTQQAWMYIYMNYRDKADWFFKADDDSFVVVPYLREFYSHLDPAIPAHYGRRLQYSGLPGAENTFVSGGSGMLLSGAAVAALGKSVQHDPSVWAGPVNGPADLLTSRTLHKLGIPASDSRDGQGRHRFLTLGIEAERTITRGKNADVWLWKYSADAKEGPGCCSDKWIATHYIKEKQMYTLHNVLQMGCAMNPNAFPFLEPPPLS